MKCNQFLVRMVALIACLAPCRLIAQEESRLNAVRPPVLTITATPQPPSNWKQDPRVLRCEPTVLTSDDDLKIILGTPHPQELAIVRDYDQELFFLISKEEVANAPSLMSAQEFALRHEIVLARESSAIGANERALRKIFQTAGSYRVLLSEALESEEGGYFCRVCIPTSAGQGCS